jgi:hypothetical protein
VKHFFKRSYKVIVALTVQEILDEHIAKNRFKQRITINAGRRQW